MKFLFTLILICLFSFFSQTFAADIKFTVEKGYLIIPVKIKNDVAVEMAIATGSDVSLIDTGAVEKYKLRLSYTGVGVVTGTNDQTVNFCDVAGIVIGGENPTSIFMKLSSLETIKKKVGRDIFGVLGADFFKGKSIKIDFKNYVLRYTNPSDSKDAKTDSSLKKFVYKMDYTKPNIFNSETTLPVSNEIIINDKKIKSLFDTGLAFPISLLPTGIKDLSLENPEKETVKATQLKSLKFFDYEMSNIPSILVGKKSIFDRNTNDYGSIIGIGVLQNFVITFDYKNKILILEKF
jgi:hypothetical protein